MATLDTEAPVPGVASTRSQDGVSRVIDKMLNRAERVESKLLRQGAQLAILSGVVGAAAVAYGMSTHIEKRQKNSELEKSHGN